RKPLLWAAEHGHKIIVKQLLKKSEVDPDLKDGNGCTPLSWAPKNGDEAIFNLLLEIGRVDVDCKPTNWTCKGITPLMLAAAGGHQATVHKLIMTGKADIESRTNGNFLLGRTILSDAASLEAAEGGHDGVIKLLLGKGADPNSKDKGGLTPLFWAARNGHDATVKMLLA
ncbi:uncharacterized protein A1O9_05270, partial [Exophiala aquamarina CBS 119918]